MCKIRIEYMYGVHKGSGVHTTLANENQNQVEKSQPSFIFPEVDKTIKMLVGSMPIQRYIP